MLNPADLSSRGCTAKQLLESKWWEGPQWLYQDQSTWIQETLSYDEKAINIERKKRLITALSNNERNVMMSCDWHLDYFSQYLKTLRMCAWILRFLHNTRNKNDKYNGELSFGKIDKAEILVFKVIQRESFLDENEKKTLRSGRF